jgi:hypothetical protein
MFSRFCRFLPEAVLKIGKLRFAHLAVKEIFAAKGANIQTLSAFSDAFTRKSK